MNKAQAKKKLDNILKEAEELKEIIDAPDNGRWKPEEREYYWRIISGSVGPGLWTDDGRDNRRYETGNCYKTKEQAQAVVDLKKHIYKFPMPDKEFHFYMLIRDKNFCFEEFSSFDKFYDITAYHNGHAMTSKSTSADRTERLRLLKLAHNI